VNRPKSTTPHGNGNSPRAWAYGEDHARATRAAVTLYHHAALCDETNQWQMARVMWAKYAEVGRRVQANASTNLMKFTGQRLW